MTSREAVARGARLSQEPWQTSAAAVTLFKGSAHSVREIVAHRELLGMLVRRELKARYKDSSLGFLWSLLRPLSILLVYYVAIGKFLGAERAIPDFAIYIFTGLTIWQLFQEIVASSTGSIVGNSGLVRKVYLPREVFPLSTVGSALFNFGTQFLILIVAVLVVGRFPTGNRLWYLPLSLAVVLTFATAIGLFLAAVNVYLRDVQYLVEITLMILFWASPVVYSWEQVSHAITGSWVENIYLGNPVTMAVLGIQRAMWVAGSDEPVPPDLTLRLLIALAVGAVLVWLSQRLFNRLEGNFAQEL